jgi:pimeloyl-ACP methyl ester carboxylesterase
MARLAVVKYRATVPKKKGTLFLNPGGPGGSGVEFVTSFGDQMSKDIQGHYDIVSWDPRGVGSYTL